jgi:orotate phosphoribosyltransferase
LAAGGVSAEMESEDRTKLLELLTRKSVCHGHFTLASGAQSDLYIDARLTTFDPEGAILLGRTGWQLLRQTAVERNVRVDAIGGLTLGADPVALSIGIAARLDSASSWLQVFTVRKETKTHGRRKRIEGNFAEGNTVVVVDDVITTGGSTLQAIDAIQEAGGNIAFVLVLVDRQEGGRNAIEQRGHRVVSIFTRSDFVKGGGS